MKEFVFHNYSNGETKTIHSVSETDAWNELEKQVNNWEDWTLFE